MRMAFDLPDFKGLHSLELTSGEIRTVNLDGFIQRPDGTPTYLVSSDGTMYNYYNVICFKKLPRGGI